MEEEDKDPLDKFSLMLVGAIISIAIYGTGFFLILKLINFLSGE